MLSGSTPFSGDFSKVMEAHKILPPPPLKAKKVRKKLKRVINSALSKDPDHRPQTAEALASQLRSRSEGIFGLLRRAGMIYTEHITKFLGLSTIFHLPMVVFTIALIVISFLKVSETLDSTVADVLRGGIGVLLFVVGSLCTYLLIGTISWVVVQSLAVPLRPIRVRSSLREARRKWKRFAGTGVMSFVLSLGIGIITCGIGFLVTSVIWTLLAPVVMMENLSGRKALKRSKDLVRRSLATSIAAVALTVLIPFVGAGTISFVVNITAKALRVESSQVKGIANLISEGDKQKPKASEGSEQQQKTDTAAEPTDDKQGGINVSFGNGSRVALGGSEKNMRTRVTDAVLESLLQVLLLPLQIIVTSFTAIIIALLYLKTRQAGGEPLQDLLATFEDTDRPRKKWQERVRQRLIQSGRLTTTSKP
jgi:hypothetical protein